MALSFLKFVTDQLTGKKQRTPDQIRTLIQSGRLTEASKAIARLMGDQPELVAEKLALEGEVLFQQKCDQEAEVKFRQALRLAPGLAAAHCDLSMVLAEQGDIELATMHAHFAVEATRKKDPRSLAQLGYCQLCAGNLAAAEKPLRTATSLDPTNPYTWNNLGIIAVTQGNKAKALRYFEKALQLKPDLASAQHHLATTQGLTPEQSSTPDIGHTLSLIVQGDQALAELINDNVIGEALAHLERACVSQPESAELHIALLQLYEYAGDVQDGLELLERWQKEHPDNTAARRELGLAYSRLQDAKHTESWLAPLMLDQGEDDAEMLRALASALSMQEKFEEAIPLFDKLCKLEPSDHNLGLQSANLSNACHYDEALAICEDLVARGAPAPGYGATLCFMGRFDEALCVINQGLERQPNEPNLRMFRGQIALLHENFREGWQDYAFRNYANHAKVRALPLPRWKGEPLNDKGIMVLAEQGLGDQIMFASCLPDLQSLHPRRIVVESIDRITETLVRSFPQIEFIGTKQNTDINWVKDYADIDYFVHLGDLPQHFRPTVQSFPQRPGYLNPDTAKAHHWAQQITDWELQHHLTPGKRLRIGFSWRGGTPGTRSPIRTIQSDMVMSLDPAQTVTWVCLQYGDVAQDIQQLSSDGFPVAYWPESIQDLDEFAALISTLDLVVTVCNTTVHYAGALGTPVWVMSPKIPEWRYGLTSTTMPWYPSSKMYRQDTPGNWDAVLVNICRDIQTLQSPESTQHDASRHKS